MSGIADIYDAELHPGKLDLLRGWVAAVSWFTGDAGELEQVSSYRFVDPAGEVGIEGFLLRGGGTTWHVPVTYRAAPRDDAPRSAYLGAMEHSVLGMRHVYDAETDPVYLAELDRVVRERDHAAGQRSVETGEVTDPPMRVRGTGSPDGATGRGVRVERALEDAGERVADEAGRLVGTWDDAEGTHHGVLASIG